MKGVTIITLGLVGFGGVTDGVRTLLNNIAVIQHVHGRETIKTNERHLVHKHTFLILTGQVPGL